MTSGHPSTPPSESCVLQHSTRTSRQMTPKLNLSKPADVWRPLNAFAQEWEGGSVRVLHLGAEERGRVEASVGLWGLKVLCRGSLMLQLPQQHIGSPQKVTAPQGLSWGQGVAPHLETPSFGFCAPCRLWAAVVHQAVSGCRGQERRRRRVALAGEPPCPGPGPRVRGFAHLSQLDGVCSSLLHP